MKIFRNLFIFLISILLVTGCSLSTEDINSNGNFQKVENKKSDVETNKKEEKKSETKTLKMGSSEYFEYIKNTLQQVSDNSSNIKLNEFRKRGVAYLVATFYTNKYLDDTTMNNEIKNAMKIFYDNFSINKYKSGGFFSTDYELLNISFYNYKSDKKKTYDEYKFVQLDFTEITKYSNFEDFYKKETECISGC